MIAIAFYFVLVMTTGRGPDADEALTRFKLQGPYDTIQDCQNARESYAHMSAYDTSECFQGPRS